MDKTNRKRIWKWVKAIVFTYFASGIALYFLQSKILFHPQKLSQDYHYQFEVPFREINIPLGNEKNLSLVQFTVPDSIRRGIVLYFHGNRSNINRYAQFAPNFTKAGYEVWMMDYPGFGKSRGKRTEKILYEDALILYKMAIKVIAADSIILYGRSLGTGIAAQLATIRDCRRLILETPYYSMEAMAHQYLLFYPFMSMAKYVLPTGQYLKEVRAPITILHGTRDGIVSYNQSRRLAKEIPGIELITIQGGQHNNLNEFPLFHQKLDSLLRR